MAQQEQASLTIVLHLVKEKLTLKRVYLKECDIADPTVKPWILAELTSVPFTAISSARQAGKAMAFANMMLDHIRNVRSNKFAFNGTGWYQVTGSDKGIYVHRNARPFDNNWRFMEILNKCAYYYSNGGYTAPKNIFQAPNVFKGTIIGATVTLLEEK